MIQKRGKDTYLVHNNLEIFRIIGVAGYVDTVIPLEDGLYQWHRNGPPTAQMTMAIQCTYAPDFFMLPALNYNGNGWGTFCEYVGDRHEGTPWMYAWHRSSVPGMGYSEGVIGDERYCLALFGEANSSYSMSLYRQGGGTKHSLHWPERELPMTLQHYRYGPPYSGPEQVQSGFSAFIAWGVGIAPKKGYRSALDAAWRLSQQSRSMPLNQLEIYDLGIAFANSLYTRESDGFCGFNIGLAWESGQWLKRKKNKYEIGWCGQNASLANAFLWRALHADEGCLMDIGFSVLDSWIEKAYLPIGVLHSYYDPGQDRYIEACNLGTAGLMYFEAHDLAGALHASKPEYHTTAMDICNFAVSNQRSDGCFARCWKDDGSVAIAEGTVGAYLIMPLVEGYKRTGETTYLDAAVRAFRYYFGELEHQGFTTAGALDIFSIDKESSIPLLKSALMLHSVLGEVEWLNYAVDAAWYLSTWQHSYSTPFPVDSLLHQIDYDSHGGTITSTVHQGMDPYALSYVPDLLLLWELTGENRWWDRAQAAWRNGCQNISDGTLIVQGKKRPRGSQDEAYLVTRQGNMGQPTQWLVAWPGAFRMETIRRVSSKPYSMAFFSGERRPK